MLTIQQIRKDKVQVVKGLEKRGWSNDQLKLIDTIIELDDNRKESQQRLDGYLQSQNLLSKSIGKLYKEGKTEEANEAKQEVLVLKEKSQVENEAQKSIKEELDQQLLNVPNLPHELVKAGQTEEDNEVVQDWDSDLPLLDEGSQPHWNLAKTFNIIDFELGAKITGSGFPLYRNHGARLQRALISFFLDSAVEAGYEEIMPPLLVNDASARATGQLPDKEGQMYHFPGDNLYLIPTAEVPITNIYRDTILDISDLPIKLTGYTPCFRREAGSYGADVKGLNRVHQFDKVEIVQITDQENSYDVLDEMVSHVKGLLHKLELPFRILRLCGGDLGFTSALTYDFEVYSAAQKRWLEVSSVSNFETYQSNRLKLRYKNHEGQKTLAHTLNGSALALARIVASLLENNQKGGQIVIPSALRPYFGSESIPLNDKN